MTTGKLHWHVRVEEWSGGFGNRPWPHEGSIRQFASEREALRFASAENRRYRAANWYPGSPHLPTGDYLFSKPGAHYAEITTWDCGGAAPWERLPCTPTQSNNG